MLSHAQVVVYLIGIRLIGEKMVHMSPIDNNKLKNLIELQESLMAKQSDLMQQFAGLADKDDEKSDTKSAATTPENKSVGGEDHQAPEENELEGDELSGQKAGVLGLQPYKVENNNVFYQVPRTSNNSSIKFNADIVAVTEDDKNDKQGKDNRADVVNLGKKSGLEPYKVDGNHVYYQVPAENSNSLIKFNVRDIMTEKAL